MRGFTGCVQEARKQGPEVGSDRLLLPHSKGFLCLLSPPAPSPPVSFTLLASQLDLSLTSFGMSEICAYTLGSAPGTMKSPKMSRSHVTTELKAVLKLAPSSLRGRGGERKRGRPDQRE